ncbi:MAG: zinc metallopeptidase [Phycisphaerales bacterium]|nr:zinc metallopeptidase [Phycisphaerales bacterium]
MMLSFLIGWDPMYYAFIIPGALLAMWAQFRVKSAYAQMSRKGTFSGLSGAEAAAQLLRAHGLEHVRIEPAQGILSDHYDPRQKVLRLSRDVYAGRSIASVGIAAHEAGHAIQDRAGYAPLALRNGIVPLASVGGSLAMVFLMLGLFLRSFNLTLVGIGLFSVIVLFQLVNLPVEFNASKRARASLLTSGIIQQVEDRDVAKVLNAAALTYVAATLTAVLQLLYFLYRAGLLGGRRE